MFDERDVHHTTNLFKAAIKEHFLRKLKTRCCPCNCENDCLFLGPQILKEEDVLGISEIAIEMMRNKKAC